MTNVGDQIVVQCPECDNRYKLPSTAAGKRANCKCGVTFEIRLPSPAAAKPAAPATPAPGDCVNHPGVAAQFGCSQCRSLICDACDVARADGTHVCSKCAAQGPARRIYQPSQQKSTAMPSQFPPPLPAAVLSPTGFGVQAPGAAAPATPGANSLAGAKCEQHEESPAVVRCNACGKPVCATCVFRFPNGASLCPKCATDTTRPFSQKRKLLAGWSLGLAGVGTLMLIVLSTGMLAGLSDMTAVLLMLACFGTGCVAVIVGFVLALCSLSKREGNPPMVWIAIAWNSLLIAIPVVGVIALFALGFMSVLFG